MVSDAFADDELGPGPPLSSDRALICSRTLKAANAPTGTGGIFPVPQTVSKEKHHFKHLAEQATGT